MQQARHASDMAAQCPAMRQPMHNTTWQTFQLLKTCPATRAMAMTIGMFNMSPEHTGFAWRFCASTSA